MLEKLEQAIESKSVCLLSLNNGKKIEALVHKLVYLEGSLCIVGEEVGDRCLITLCTSNIKSVSELNSSSYQPNYCAMEIHDFISAIRAVSDSEERLVLKITNPTGDLNLNPPHQYLANPYITSNPMGELIWAASVEKNEELYEWLYELSGIAIVLDPQSIKEELAQYIEKRENSSKAA